MEEKAERFVHPSGGAQQTLLINESGFYVLELSSKMSKERGFKHWVSAEVFPSIGR